MAEILKRGDIVVVAAPGDYGKPRPAVVVQTDALTESGLKSVVVCLMSSAELRAPLFRIRIEASPVSGLDQSSQIMVDKLFTMPVEKVTRVIGQITDEQRMQLNRTLAFVVGLG